MTPLLKEYKGFKRFNFAFIFENIIKENVCYFINKQNLKKSYFLNIFELNYNFFIKILESKKDLLYYTRNTIADYINSYNKVKFINKFIKCYNLLKYFNFNDIKVTILTNIYLLDLINSYRGWRHLNGMPTKGQRTWSNGWTAFRSNTIFREFQINLAKKFYTESNFSIKEKKIAFMAEQVNKLWSVQWEAEWMKAKKKRKKVLKHNYRYFRVDLGRLSQGNVNSKKIRKNRKKQQNEKRNHFILGFDKGFTAYLLKNNILEDPMRTKQKNNIRKKKLKALEIQFKEQEKFKVLRHIRKKLKLENAKKKMLMKGKKKKTIWD